MLGIVVSAANYCDYNINHHELVPLDYWKDAMNTKRLASNRRELSLSITDQLLCNLAKQITNNNHSSRQKEILKKESGLNDRAILDAVHILAYFIFVNHLVFRLGFTFSEYEMKGYKY
jgi:alkylhydroperoxidase family enzyme